MWNGTAAILKPTPATTRMIASTRRGSVAWAASGPAILRRLVVPARPFRPDRPYISDIPYSRMPSEKAPRRKYLTAASFERALGLR